MTSTTTVAQISINAASVQDCFLSPSQIDNACVLRYVNKLGATPAAVAKRESSDMDPEFVNVLSEASPVPTGTEVQEPLDFSTTLSVWGQQATTADQWALPTTLMTVSVSAVAAPAASVIQQRHQITFTTVPAAAAATTTAPEVAYSEPVYILGIISIAILAFLIVFSFGFCCGDASGCSDERKKKEVREEGEEGESGDVEQGKQLAGKNRMREPPADYSQEVRGRGAEAPKEVTELCERCKRREALRLGLKLEGAVGCCAAQSRHGGEDVKSRVETEEDERWQGKKVGFEVEQYHTRGREPTPESDSEWEDCEERIAGDMRRELDPWVTPRRSVEVRAMEAAAQNRHMWR